MRPHIITSVVIVLLVVLVIAITAMLVLIGYSFVVMATFFADVVAQGLLP